MRRFPVGSIDAVLLSSSESNKINVIPIITTKKITGIIWPSGGKADIKQCG
jgi:hypothetical protein